MMELVESIFWGVLVIGFYLIGIKIGRTQVEQGLNFFGRKEE
jgi:hypothetical protein